MKKPNFFIVGAAKAGTTSLYHYLEQHPEIGMASYKEPCHFCYNQLFKTENDYFQLYTNIASDKKVIGEASTNYLAAAESPELIKKFDAKAKAIVVLRNPVDRAFSLYKWMVRAGFEGDPTFEMALEREPKRQQDSKIEFSPVKYNYSYFGSGLYYEQIKRYQSYFNDKDLLLINFDDLKTNLDDVLKKIYSFLEVNYSKINNPKVHNKAKFPYSPQFQYYLRNELYNALTFSVHKKDHMFGNPVVDFLAGINSNLGKIPMLNKNTAKMLQHKYQDDLLKLSEIIPFSINSWKEKY
jgi:hypothetical protein